MTEEEHEDVAVSLIWGTALAIREHCPTYPPNFAEIAFGMILRGEMEPDDDFPHKKRETKKADIIALHDVRKHID